MFAGRESANNLCRHGRIAAAGPITFGQGRRLERRARDGRREPGGAAIRSQALEDGGMVLEDLLAELRTHIPETQILIRLALATVLGAVVGIDREAHDHPAGLRTHMLTSAAAALFAILTLELYHEVRAQNGERMTADPIRIVEAVTAGVAFLAAGAIIHGRGTVHGLTTGAGMWLAGAIGVACGIGRFTIAFMAVALAIIVLTLVRGVERLVFKNRDHPAKPKAEAGKAEGGRPPGTFSP